MPVCPECGARSNELCTCLHEPIFPYDQLNNDIERTLKLLIRLSDVVGELKARVEFLEDDLRRHRIIV